MVVAETFSMEEIPFPEQHVLGFSFRSFFPLIEVYFI